MSAARDLGGIAVPAAIVIGAAAGGFESGIAQKGIHIATGFKVPAGGGTAVPTPFAALFLAPQPIGMLPERFFMSKPQIPGTRIFLDPLHNVNVQTTRIGDDRRTAARIAQTRGLQVLLEDLTDDELSRLLLNRGGERSAISFVDPRRASELLHAELDQRKTQRDTQEAVARFAAERRTESLLGGPIGVGLEIQAMLAARSPVVVLVIAAPTTRVGPLDATGRPTAAFVRSLSPLGGPVAMGSLQPQGIHPVNAAALANQRAAKGLQRELVHERADP